MQDTMTEKFPADACFRSSSHDRHPLLFRDKNMQLAAIVIGVLIASMLVLFLPHVDRRAAQQAENGAMTKTAQTDSTPVLVINEPLPYSGASGGCCYPVAPDNPERIRGEALYREGKYKEAAQHFECAIKLSPMDTRSTLGLGKSYLKLQRYGAALTNLSILRNACKDHKASTEQTAKLTSSRFFGPPPWPIAVSMNDFDSLPDQARDAMDYEARLAMEEAVLQKAGTHPAPAKYAGYTNDHHYKILRACLQLARQYHAANNLEELRAVYQLAEENTRGLPAGLILDLSVPGNSAQKWSRLARLALNGRNEEETQWYLHRMAAVCENLPEHDIRRAATYHKLAQTAADDEKRHDYFNRAHKYAKDDKTHPAFLADCAYDLAMCSYEDKAYDSARDMMAEALKSYEASGQENTTNASSGLDLADCHYNLGILHYLGNNKSQAQAEFETAVRIYKSTDGGIPHAYMAGLNRSILALEKSDANEAWLKEYATGYNTGESLLGIYYAMNDEPEKALPWLAKAIEAYFPQQGPCLQGATNGTIGPQQTEDLAYRDAEILRDFFKRGGRINQSVSSNFSDYYLPPSAAREETLYPLSNEGVPSFSRAIRVLYPWALRRTGRTEELRAFLLSTKSSSMKLESDQLATTYVLADASLAKTQPATGKTMPAYEVPPAKTEGIPPGFQGTGGRRAIYLSLLRQKLLECWFSSPHEAPVDIIVRLRIAQDGSIKVNSVEPAIGSSDLMNSIERQALVWASPVPPPPPDLKDKEIVAVFNAQSYAFPSYAAPIGIINRPVSNEW